METPLSVYKEAEDALDRYGAKRDEFVACLGDISTLEADLSSQRAIVTQEIDKDSKTSKAALKDIVEGDSRVFTAKNELTTAKNRKAAIVATMDFIKMIYDLKKKRMDCLNTELKYT